MPRKSFITGDPAPNKFSLEQDYLEGVIVFAAAPIIVGVLMLLFGVLFCCLRGCCNTCGTRKRKETYSKASIRGTQAVFTVFAVLAFVGCIVAISGSAKLSAAIKNLFDTVLDSSFAIIDYIEKLINDVTAIQIKYGSEPPEPTTFVEDVRKAVDDTVEKYRADVLDYDKSRHTAFVVLFVVSIILMALGGVAIIFKVKKLPMIVACFTMFFLFIVLILAAITLPISVVLGDACQLVDDYVVTGDTNGIDNLSTVLGCLRNESPTKNQGVDKAVSEGLSSAVDLMNDALSNTNNAIDSINSSPGAPSPPISRLPLIFFNASNDVFDEVIPISEQVSAVNRTAATISQIDSAPLVRAANQVADYAGLVPSVQFLANCSLVSPLLNDIKDSLCVDLLDAFSLVTTGAFIAAAGLLFSIPVLILGNKRWHGASKSVTKYGKGGATPAPGAPLPPIGAPQAPLGSGAGGMGPGYAPGGALLPETTSYGYSGGFYANSSYPGQILNEEDETTTAQQQGQGREDERLINSNSNHGSSFSNNVNKNSNNSNNGYSNNRYEENPAIRASASLPRDTASGSSAPFVGRDVVKLPPIK